jgi:putative colanic acid biosynthesis UDP-glucose lipid carrier transferase
VQTKTNGIRILDHLSDKPLLMGFAALCRRIAAALVAFSSLRIGMWLYGVPLTEKYQALLIIVGLLSFILMSGRSDGLFESRISIWNTVAAILGSWVALVVILLIIGYATKTSSGFSRVVLFAWALATPVVIIAVQLLIDIIFSRISQLSRYRRRVVIAGATPHSLLLAKNIRENRQLGLSVEGIFEDRGAERLGQTGPNQLLGRLRDLPDYVRENDIDVIYIALPIRNMQRVSELLDELQDTTSSIYYVPDVFVFDLIQCRTDEVDGIPVVALCETPFYGSRGLVKRFSDVAIASAVLLLLSPLFVSIALGIKLTTPGSVIFKQRRYGLDGREIVVYKFRTMYVSEDSGEINQATKNDSRVTPFGGFLRKYSLDEIPQFVNVLKGNMSVVGPRPHAIAHNEEYRKLIKGYMIRHKVNPGLTGLAQIRGYRGETATVEDMRLRVEADLEYLRNWSLGLDLKIIFRTIAVMFTDKKAY